jgi:hypothetical protein
MKIVYSGGDWGRLVRRASRLVASFESVADGGINGLAWSVRMAAELLRLWDRYFMDGLINIIGFGIRIASYPLRLAQAGLFQAYALTMVVTVLIFLAYGAWHFRF